MLPSANTLDSEKVLYKEFCLDRSIKWKEPPDVQLSNLHHAAARFAPRKEALLLAQS
jgi:hypothetical protein